MKTRKPQIRHGVLFLFLFFISIAGYSQGTDLFIGGKSRFYVGFTLSPVQSGISINAPAALTQLEYDRKSSLSFSMVAGFMFSDYFGISSGLGYSTLKSEIMAGRYAINYDTTDVNESYTRFITGDNIKETQQISYIKIPLIINTQIPMGKKFGMFLNTGLNLMFPVSNHFNNSGRFTYEGYYPAYNVRITGVPYEGFEKDYSNSDEGEIQIKPINLGLTASGGIQYSPGEKIQFSLGLTYDSFFSDISDYGETGNYRLSSNPGQMKSIMEGSSASTASSLGLAFSIRFFL
ncbi:MAG TPA: outer membrane beta-barrel protein [Bacteroidales bacterium]|nr:outer membrane beta-barrel protein [Bacteroidales bacterium]